MKKFIQKIAAMAITGIMSISSMIPAVAATSQNYVPTIDLNNNGIALASATTGTSVDYPTAGNGMTILAVDTNYNQLESYDTSVLKVGNMGGVNAPATKTYNNVNYTFSHYEYATSVRNYVASYNQRFEFYVDPPMTILAVYTTGTPNPPAGPIVGMYKDPEFKDGRTFYYLNEAAPAGTNISAVKANITFGRSQKINTDANNEETFSTQAANIYTQNNNIQFIVASAIISGGPINFTGTVAGARENAQIKIWNFGSEAFNNVQAGTAVNGITLDSVSDTSATQITAGDGKIYQKGYNTSASFNVNLGDVVKVYSSDTTAVTAFVGSTSVNNISTESNIAKFIAPLNGTMTISNAGYIYAVTVNMYASVDVGSNVENPVENTTYTFLQNNQAECTNWLDVSGGTSGNFATGRKGSFAENIFDNNTTNSASGQLGVSFGSKDTFTITTTGDNQTVKLYMLRNGSGTSTVKVTSSVDSGYSDSFIVQNRDAENQEAFVVTLPKAGTYTFTVSSSATMLFKAILSGSGSGGTSVSNGSIYGIVSDSATHNSISGATVTLLNSDGTSTGKTAITSLTGSYSFSGVETGKTYVVKAEKSGYTANQATSASLTISGVSVNIELTPIATENSTETTTIAVESTETTTAAPVDQYYDVVGTGSVDDSTGLQYNFQDSKYDGKKAHMTGAQASGAVYGMVDAADNYLIYSTAEGLTITDNSSVSNAAYIPLGKILSEGTVTVTGKLKLSSDCKNGINIIRFGANGIGIRYDGSKIVLSDDKTYTTSSIAYTPGNDIDITWVIDITNKKATLTTADGTIEQTFTTAQSSDLLVLNTGSTATFDTSCKYIAIKHTDSVVITTTEATTSTTTEVTTEATTKEQTTETTTSSPVVSDIVWHKYYVNAKDVETNNDTNDTSFFSGTANGTNSLATTVDVDGKTYTLNYRTGSTAPNISFTVESGYVATLYFVSRSSGSSARVLTLTNSDGSYENTGNSGGSTAVCTTFEGLESGTYTLSASGNIQYQMVAVRLESTGPVTTGTINVTVQDQNGNAISGADVSCNGITGSTDTNGTVSLNKVTAGDNLTVTAAKDGDTGSANVSLTAGSSANVTVKITITKGTIRANVTNGTNPITGAVVTATNGSNTYNLVATSTNGVYELSGIPAGTYTVTATSSGKSASGTATVTAAGVGTVNITIEGIDPLEQERQTKIDTLLTTLLKENDPSNGSVWNSETSTEFKWSYINGCMITAFMDMYEVTGEDKYLTVSDEYQSGFVNDDGTVAGTRTSAVKSSTDLDDVNPGKSLLDLIEAGSANSAKYEKCTTEQLSAILNRANRIEGNTLNFYHKGNYPYQVWLDGTYMALPYMIQYENVIDKNADIVNVANDVTAQFENVYNKMRNPETGLYYHGYDSQADSASSDTNTAHAMSWAKGSTASSSPYKVSSFASDASNEGCSANYWLRAMGWYGMALIDSYEQMSRAEQASGTSLATQKAKIADIFTKLMDAVLVYQDASGLWYQVVDNPQDEANKSYNYLETSGSAAFAACLMKGYNLGVLNNESYYNAGLKAFNELTDTKLNTTGGLEEICGTAGLGGVTTAGKATGHTSNSATRGPKYNYRDGSFSYYVSEKLATNDAKGAAPYLMAYAQKLKHDQNA